MIRAPSLGVWNHAGNAISRDGALRRERNSRIWSCRRSRPSRHRSRRAIYETLPILRFPDRVRLACRLPELQGIDPENITYYFRRVMVIASENALGMAVWRKSLFAIMHLN